MSTAGETTPTRRPGGLGALIKHTVEESQERTQPDSARTSPPPPPPATVATDAAQAPLKVGEVNVLADRKGRHYVPKSVNVPLDDALWIQAQLGTFRRADGSVSHRFQDVLIDTFRLGRQALEKKKAEEAG